MTNSEVIRALGRWSHDPAFSDRGQKALRRAAAPHAQSWPERIRAGYERTAPGYDTFLALPDARQAIAERNLPPVLGDLQNHTTWSWPRPSPRPDLRSPPWQSADWDEVFGAAAESGTAIEINASIDRQDADFVLAQRAARAGCWISIGSRGPDPSGVLIYFGLFMGIPRRVTGGNLRRATEYCAELARFCGRAGLDSSRRPPTR